MPDPRSLVPPDRLRRLARRRDLPGLVFLGLHLSVLAFTGTLVVLTLDSWWLWPAMFLHGIVIVHLFAPFHETAHSSAFRSRRLNTAVLWATGLVLGLPPTFFRLEHAAHHAHTSDPDRDPEMVAASGSVAGYLWYATALPYFWALFSSLFRHPLGAFNAVERAFIPASQRRRVQREAVWMWVVYVTIACASIATGSTLALTCWLVPRILGEPFMRIIRMSEHGACPLVPDMLLNTRTVLTLRPIQWLNWNMAFHAEHHAIPAVPFHALPALHADLGPHLAELETGYGRTQRVILNAARSRQGAKQVAA
ncbi:MAG: fatty acid desaturase [Geminicoccaceae bacterium]